MRSGCVCLGGTIIYIYIYIMIHVHAKSPRWTPRGVTRTYGLSVVSRVIDPIEIFLPIGNNNPYSVCVRTVVFDRYTAAVAVASSHASNNDGDVGLVSIGFLVAHTYTHTHTSIYIYI